MEVKQRIVEQMFSVVKVMLMRKVDKNRETLINTLAAEKMIGLCSA